MCKTLLAALAAAMAVAVMPMTAGAQSVEFGPGGVRVRPPVVDDDRPVVRRRVIEEEDDRPVVRRRVIEEEDDRPIVRRRVIEEPAEREVIVRRRVVPARLGRIVRGEVCRVRRETVVRPSGRVVRQSVRVCR